MFKTELFVVIAIITLVATFSVAVFIPDKIVVDGWVVRSIIGFFFGFIGSEVFNRNRSK